MTSSSTSPENLTAVANVSRNGRSLAKGAPHSALVMLADPHSPAAEAYRSLAANLQFGYADRQLRTIGITSAAAGEGKSTTVANLAIALAGGGRRVIVIDADLRRPGLHTLFGVDGQEGLANVLLNDHAQLPLLHTPAPGVRLLPSGSMPGNPLEALASRRFEQVLALARAQAHLALVETAPAGGPPHAAVLAPRLESHPLVVTAVRTQREPT